MKHIDLLISQVSQMSKPHVDKEIQSKRFWGRMGIGAAIFLFITLSIAEYYFDKKSNIMASPVIMLLLGVSLVSQADKMEIIRKCKNGDA